MSGINFARYNVVAESLAELVSEPADLCDRAAEHDPGHRGTLLAAVEIQCRANLGRNVAQAIAQDRAGVECLRVLDVQQIGSYELSAGLLERDRTRAGKLAGHRLAATDATRKRQVVPSAIAMFVRPSTFRYS